MNLTKHRLVICRQERSDEVSKGGGHGESGVVVATCEDEWDRLKMILTMKGNVQRRETQLQDAT